MEMINPLAQAIGLLWIQVKDGDPRVSAIYQRHYSAYQYKDNRRKRPGYRNRHLVLGPGEKIVLLAPDCKAIFGWRKFIDASGQVGVNCAFFRNEGAFGGTVYSSQMILAAERWADVRWPSERLYTYIDGEKTAGRRSKLHGPGYIFIKAGWQECGETKGGLVILEKLPDR